MEASMFYGNKPKINIFMAINISQLQKSNFLE